MYYFGQTLPNKFFSPRKFGHFTCFDNIIRSSYRVQFGHLNNPPIYFNGKTIALRIPLKPNNILCLGKYRTPKLKPYPVTNLATPSINNCCAENSTSKRQCKSTRRKYTQKFFPVFKRKFKSLSNESVQVKTNDALKSKTQVDIIL